MRAVAVIQFYFSYVLPRAEDWGSDPLGFQLPDFKVLIRPRAPDEDLFPNEIDQTLSTMQLSLIRLNAPMGQTSLVVRDYCHDRIEARVESSVPSPQAVQEPPIQESFLLAAIKCCNIFLNHCRTISRSPFIRGIQRDYRLEDQRYYIRIPRSITWFDGETGNQLPAYEEGTVNAAAASGALLSPERGSVTWAQIISSLSEGQEPNLPRSLLVDAEESLRTERLREAILHLAVSCEVAANDHLRRTGRLSDPFVKQIRKEKSSFAVKYLDKIPAKLAGKSLRYDNPKAFELIEKLYRVRNNVMHEGRCYYKESGFEIRVDDELATAFLRATETALEWLAQL